jgi:3-oxoacyl-[acyl-carrier-protein] synthase II
LAADLIKGGTADVCITGGSDVITELPYFGFHALRSLAPKKCQPFDKNRAGLVMGEGAGILVLESLDRAISRKAKIYAEILGYGLSADAYHETSPDPTGEGAAISISNALENALISAEEVDYINAHGTGTPQNDLMETNAIKKIFKEKAYLIPVSSTKSMIGHSLGAAGALEAIACILAINNSFIPPTINYETRDPLCDLDYTPNASKHKEIGIAISNNFAFAGNNACLVIKKWKKE